MLKVNKPKNKSSSKILILYNKYSAWDIKSLGTPNIKISSGDETWWSIVVLPNFFLNTDTVINFMWSEKHWNHWLVKIIHKQYLHKKNPYLKVKYSELKRMLFSVARFF